jgi:hypothetical protein
MHAAGESSAGTAALDGERLRAVALLLIAAAPDGMRRAEVKRRLIPLTAHRLPAPQGAALIDREIAALELAELIRVARGRVAASAAGRSQAALFLGRSGGEPLPAGDAVIAEIIAKALGLPREPKRLKALGSRDGLCLAIVQQAYAVKLRGSPTPARLRCSLAAIALARAFGDRLAIGTLGLSARAGRALAGQLAARPRDYGTDHRLIAALAADHLAADRAAGAKKGAARAAVDVAALRLKVLQRYLDAVSPPGAGVGREQTRAESPPRAQARPDLCGFASEVRAHAARSAHGWAGNRKAYISHVWRLLRERRPEWGLSEIEFKCMLAEAHRTGELRLANADLKERSNLRDVEDSALVYKNAVFHFVRVDV